MNKRRNIGILAHVDAGKTTLTEQLLRHGGAIHVAGAVDAGTAHTDKLVIERRRGISIRATCASLRWGDVDIHLIDTPGHADFLSEVERSLWALDGAVLLLSAVEGVQPQAELLFAALQKAKLPCVIFINKADREGADVARVIEEARGILSPCVVDYQNDEQLHLLLAEEDDEALRAYVEQKFWTRSVLLPPIAEMTKQCRAYPALCGSALRDTGIRPLLDAIVYLLPAPRGDAGGPLSGVVFSAEEDKALGRAAHVRLFSGTLQNRGIAPPFETKITQIRTIPLTGRGEDIGVLRAGELGAVYGLSDVRVGSVLGDARLLPRRIAVGELGAPLLMASVLPEKPEQIAALREALFTLSAEDPLLSIEAYQGEPHVRVMGAVQLEVLAETLETRFSQRAAFGSPRVVYRETIRETATGFFAYTMPKPCWAVIRFQIEPLPRGSGIVYESIVPAREIAPRYQHQIEQAIPMAAKQGMLGWQLDDVKITLTGGEHHLVHTHPLDFILATPVALMDGLRRGGSVLLEPILRLHINAPEGSGGKILSEIVAMRGTILETSAQGERMHIKADVPMATSVHFSVRLASLTGGQGQMSSRLIGYRECDARETCPRDGVHPLDTAKYILAARNALGGGIFEQG